MSEPTDFADNLLGARTLLLPAALCSVKDDALVVWNRAFQKRAGVSEKELTQARLTSLILFDEATGDLVMQDQDPAHVVRFVPCVLRKPLTDELVHGRALRRNDGCLLAMLGLPTGELHSKDLFMGALSVVRKREIEQTVLS